ncbi:MAG TPA: hypothetical protein VNZ22_22940, partial [Bacillota bacterium]|nr:hypothetical protein [Bacillota bacterium]
MNPLLLTGILASWLLTAAAVQGATPALRILKSSQPGTMLLLNGDFEEAPSGKLRAWSAAPNGFSLAVGKGRQGSQTIRCENPTGSGWVGASQTVAVNRTNATPLVVRGWSKASNISGSADSDYSLYVDLVYADGTSLWGQTAPFRTGTHDWEQREVLILPEKPVKALTVHCLLRKHSGTAWFDDVSVEEIQTPGGALLFQGVPVALVSPLPRATGPKTTVTTADGLNLALRGHTVTSLQVAGHELASQTPSGFLVRDVAANSDFYAFQGDACPDLGLKLQATYKASPDRLVIEGRLSDTSRRDRAVTLVFALPVQAAGWRWGDDIRRSRPIGGQGEFANDVVVRCGATGTMSLYPLAPIYGERAGLALALDMARPAQYRLGYHAGTGQLFIAYDFGLVPETRQFPGSADFRFVLFRFDPRWGFRAAFQKFTDIFPEQFRVRSPDQGLWMPFTDISTVQDWQDFGFKYHEGNNNVAFDDAHGILSFRYTEPMTWWMRMAKEVPRTMPEALCVRDALAGGMSSTSSHSAEQRLAQVSQVASMEDESGQPGLLFRNEPWCNGAVWGLNPNPWLPVASTSNSATAGQGDNAATLYWNASIKEKLYGPGAKAHLDGEYLDSLEGYVTADLNYRREHFIYSSVPLSFASDTKRPALFKGLAVFEFTKWFSEDVHRLGKLTFANSVPYRFSFLCPWLDVMGTETDWLRAGKYHPASDAQMSLWRTLSGRKPYLLLMNTDYNTFTSDLVERYFQRSLFYGIFPSMFSHNAADNPYWQNPKWYNRDRPLFKKY